MVRVGVGRLLLTLRRPLHLAGNPAKCNGRVVIPIAEPEFTKKLQLTPSLRFPLRAGGTESVRGSPREAGGT